MLFFCVSYHIMQHRGEQAECGPKVEKWYFTAQRFFSLLESPNLRLELAFLSFTHSQTVLSRPARIDNASYKSSGSLNKNAGGRCWIPPKGVMFVTFCWCDKTPWLRALCEDFTGLQVHTEIYSCRPAWQPVSGAARWKNTWYHTGNWELSERGVRPFALKAHASDLLPSARLHILNIPWLP